MTVTEDPPAVESGPPPVRPARSFGPPIGGWSAAIGAVLLGAFVIVAVIGPLLAPYGATERPGAPFERPSTAFRLGTDDVGKDLLSLLILGTRSSLVVGLGTATVAIGVGTLAGAVAGLRGGWVDGLSMRTVDVVLALPFLPLLIVASTFSDGGLLSQILLIAALTWARPARLIRSSVLEARSRGHVEVAEGMGATQWRILWRHLSIGAAPLLIPLFLRAAMGAILLEAALAFLGLGDPSRASWGTTLYWANVRSAVLTDAWLWWVVPPGLAIALLISSMGLVGVAAEERLDPRRSRAVA
jgi:ABC-type dipeptide/oligopeptide/nickel transport system permease subunit